MRDKEIHELVNRKRRKKTKILWGRLLTVLLLFIFILTGSIYAGSFIYKHFYDKTAVTQMTVPDHGNIAEELLNKRINILILGIDDGDSEALADEPKRTDAMMLASIDPKTKQVSVISIPRDSYVMLPGYNRDKANAAFAYGGVTLAKKTIANLLNAPIHHYILLDWEGFIKIVDILGGVDLYVDNNMYYRDPYADLEIDIKKGFQHLDGSTAGKYIRFRTDELGDIGRVQRQQKFVRSMAEQHLSLNTLGKIPDIAKALDQYIQTDMSMGDIVKVVNTVKGVSKDSVRTAMVPGDFADINKISYWKVNENELKNTLKELGITYTKQ